MNFITKAPVMLCGGDYNPDQWLDRPDILEADIRMNLALPLTRVQEAFERLDKYVFNGEWV